MNPVLAQILLKAAFALVSALPVERVAAALLGRLAARIGEGGRDEQAKRTAAHMAELAELFGDIVADKGLTEEESGHMREAIVRARERLLAKWARGSGDAKATQAELAEVGLVASYAQKSSGTSRD